MRFVWMLVLIVMCGCGRGPKMGQLAGDADATRFERGAGVPRDYTRALRIYQDRCNEGRGDLVACRKFVTALLLQRGEPHEGALDPKGWMTRACVQGDWLACVPPLAPLDYDKASAACEGGNGAACLVSTWVHSFSQSGAVEEEVHERLKRACDDEILVACEGLVKRQRLSQEIVSTSALPRVERACELGDADACEALGRPLDASELCRANDFRACARAGARGDVGALDRACAHRIVDACERLAILSRDADPPDPRVVERFARACEVGAEICNQNRPEDLAIGCAAYRPTRVPANRRIRLPVLRGTDMHGASWESSPSHPFLIIGVSRDTTAERYADLARRLAPDVDLYIVTNAAIEADAFKPAQVVVLTPASASLLTAAPANPSHAGDPLVLDLGKGWPTVVDAGSTPRAVLALESGIVPATLARCTRGLLASS